MSPKELALNVCKYLSFLRLQKSASEHTLRAYQVDFSQAFDLKQFGDFKKTVPGAVQFEFLDPPTGLAAGATEDEPCPIKNHSAPVDFMELNQKALQKWKNLSPKSKNRKLSGLKGFYRWMHENDLTEQNHGCKLVLPKTPQKIPHFISVDEALTLFRVVKAHLEEANSVEEKNAIHKEAALLYLLYGGGMRVSEACSLKWQDFSAADGTLRILGKGGKHRLVSLPQNISQFIAKLGAYRNTNVYIFGEKALSTRKAYTIVKEWGIKANLLKPLHPHALRHSYATHMLNSGVNLRTLQTLLGHSSLSATEKYLHLGVDELARTMERHHPLGRTSKKEKR